MTLPPTWQASSPTLSPSPVRATIRRSYDWPMPFERRDVAYSPAEMHAIDFATGRLLLVPALAESRTLVLGSTQPEGDFDIDRCRTMGVEVIRRRSGGGAVLVSASDLVWFDLVIGADDPLWTFDLTRAFEWVGTSCQEALRSLGHDTVMHTGKLVASPLSRQICFAGTGSGELKYGDRKLVGISQRRTREFARFQVAILRRWSGTDHAELLAASVAERSKAAAELDRVATGITDEPAAILEAIQLALPH